MFLYNFNDSIYCQKCKDVLFHAAWLPDYETQFDDEQSDGQPDRPPYQKQMVMPNAAMLEDAHRSAGLPHAVIDSFTSASNPSERIDMSGLASLKEKELLIVISYCFSKCSMSVCKTTKS